jgi:hypothetical protein
MTDAPIDNANVEAVFVTVSDIMVDGTSLEGFSRTTFDLSALVDGKTETLGKLKLEADSYSDIQLELGYATDAEGEYELVFVSYTRDGDGNKILNAMVGSPIP